jgi:hypothetical protein
MVNTVSELESRVKNYLGKTKKQKDESPCMHELGWREMEVATRGWLVEKNVAGWLAGWAGWLGLPIAIGSPRLPVYILSLSIYIYGFG